MNRLRSNSNGYVNELRFFLIAFLIAATLDLTTTMHFMLKDGIETELHPAIRLVAWILGPIWGPILGKLCQFGAALVGDSLFQVLRQDHSRRGDFSVHLGSLV